MLIINIGGKYKITGTNEADIYCLSTDTMPTTPQMKNGYRLWEVDTGKEYRYDEENRQWIFWKPYLSTGGGTMSGDIDMSGNEITGLPTVTEDDAAVSYGQVTEMIEAVAGIYRGAFATYAALTAVQWQTTDPTAANYVTNNDWAVVLADETHSDQCWRYGYTVGTGWQAQFKINDTPLSQAQIDAINSGITAALLSAILGNFAEEYDATATYAVGDYCIYDGVFYQCNTAIASGGEAWNAAHWDQTSVADAVSNSGGGDVEIIDATSGSLPADKGYSYIDSIIDTKVVAVKYKVNNKIMTFILTRVDGYSAFFGIAIGYLAQNHTMKGRILTIASDGTISTSYEELLTQNSADARYLQLTGGTLQIGPSGGGITLQYATPIKSSDGAPILAVESDSSCVYVGTSYRMYSNLDLLTGSAGKLSHKKNSIRYEILDEENTAANPTLAGTETALKGLKLAGTSYRVAPASISVTLASNAWSNNAQTVTVSGVLADETKQLIQPVPASASSAEYESCGVKATAQAADSLTFSCDTTPTNNLTVYVVITEVAT